MIRAWIYWSYRLHEYICIWLSHRGRGFKQMGEQRTFKKIVCLFFHEISFLKIESTASDIFDILKVANIIIEKFPVWTESTRDFDCRILVKIVYKLARNFDQYFLDRIAKITWNHNIHWWLCSLSRYSTLLGKQITQRVSDITLYNDFRKSFIYLIKSMSNYCT